MSVEAARREVRSIVRASGSSFAAGMRVLPARRRAAIHAVYAFCRLVDDIADGTATPAEKAAGLDAWAAELDAAERGRPGTAVGAELLRAAEAYALPFAELHLVLDGMRMDSTAIVAPDEATFERYVRRVAGAVGILSMHAFGAWRGATSERFALALARGMQITNILRDVGEDAAMGRLYLPRTTLAAAGIPPDPMLAPKHPRLCEARAALGAEARRSFEAAGLEVRHHGRRAILPALVMTGPYERLLRAMERDWHRPPARRAGWRKAADGVSFALGALVRPRLSP